MKWLKEQFNRIPRTWQIIGCCVLGVAIILLLWFYGMRAVNGVSNWWYSRGTEAANKQIQQYKDIANEALKELSAEKERTAAEKARREIAERVLSDKSKNTDEKLKAYEDALGRAPTVSAPADTDALCERAKSLGISCE